jgi:heme-degrading monooxygenase HmoA
MEVNGVNKMQPFHLAQLNIARMVAPLDDPVMAGFVARLDEINRLADRSPGFVWRLHSYAGDATSVRAYDDERTLVNLSVWESVEALKAYVYKSDHGAAMRHRRQWFEKFDGPYMVLWWVPAGEIPTVGEAKARLEHLQQVGASAHAFTFREIFQPINDHTLSLGYSEI